MSDPLSNIPTSGDPLAGAPATPPPTQPATPPAKSTTPAAPVQRTASGDSTAAAAANEAKSVAQDAGESGKAVAATAKDEAQQVATEAKNHAQDLFHQARDEVTAQASTQQQRAAELLRALSGELGQMGRSADTGMAAGLVNQASGHVEQIAGWLENREPADLLDDIKRYARRNPGTFLAGAALLGFVGGRVTRSLQAQASNDGSPTAYGQQRPAAALPRHEVPTTHVPSAAPAYGGGQASTGTPTTSPRSETPAATTNPAGMERRG